MQYQEFKNYFINKAYVPYLKGDNGSARSVIANIYREGAKNPRATLYQINSSIKDINDIFTKTTKEFKAQGLDKYTGELALRHIKFAREIDAPKHPLIKTAFEEFKASFKQMYPSKRTRNLSHFIILKEHMPFVEKLKFLTRFL